MGITGEITNTDRHTWQAKAAQTLTELVTAAARTPDAVPLDWSITTGRLAGRVPSYVPPHAARKAFTAWCARLGAVAAPERRTDLGTILRATATVGRHRVKVNLLAHINDFEDDQ